MAGISVFFSQDFLCSNPVLLSSFTMHCFSALSYMNEYLATDSGGYLCTNTLLAPVAAWRNVSQRYRDGDRLNVSHRLNP